MKTLKNKLIIYDSNCKVCSSMKEVITKVTSVPEQKIKAYKDLPAELSAKVDVEKFKNEMALIDLSEGKTLYGAEGVAYIFSSQYKLVGLLLAIKPLFYVFDFLYRMQAYNRYIIAAPKSKFHCDCFPDKVIFYRIAYIVFTVSVASFLTGMFGISLKDFFQNISASEAVLQMLLIAGTGWVLQITIAAVTMKTKALDYIGHLGSIMVVGLLILVPWMIFYFIMGIRIMAIPLLSVLLSSGYMLYLHIYRLRYLGLSQWWTFSWFLLLQSTALFWVYFFHLKQ